MKTYLTAWKADDSPYRLSIGVLSGVFGQSSQLHCAMLGVSLPSCTTAIPEPPKIRIFVAASAADAVKEIGRAVHGRRRASLIELSAAASSTLAQQIEHGAEADLFLLANTQWADYLEEEGPCTARIHEPVGKTAWWVDRSEQTPRSRSQSSRISPTTDVAHLSLGDPASVPAGIYAKQALSARSRFGISCQAEGRSRRRCPASVGAMWRPRPPKQASSTRRMPQSPAK